MLTYFGPVGRETRGVAPMCPGMAAGRATSGMAEAAILSHKVVPRTSRSSAAEFAIVRMTECSTGRHPHKSVRRSHVSELERDRETTR